jgi:hypothetical protein
LAGGFCKNADQALYQFKNPFVGRNKKAETVCLQNRPKSNYHEILTDWDTNVWRIKEAQDFYYFCPESIHPQPDFAEWKNCTGINVLFMTAPPLNCFRLSPGRPRKGLVKTCDASI